MALITVAAVWIRVSTVSLVVLTHFSMIFKEHRMHIWIIPVHCLLISAFHQYQYTQSKSGFSGIVCNESIGDHWYRITLCQPTQHRSIVPLMQTTYKSWSCKLWGKCVSSFYLRQKTIVHEFSMADMAETKRSTLKSLLKLLCNLTRKQKMDTSTFDSISWINTFWTPRGRSLVSVLHTTPAQSPLHKSHRPWLTFLSITNADYMKAEHQTFTFTPQSWKILL